MTWINLEDGTVFVILLDKDLVFVRKTGDIVNIAYMCTSKRKKRIKKIKINLQTGEEVRGDAKD